MQSPGETTRSVLCPRPTGFHPSRERTCFLEASGAGTDHRLVRVRERCPEGSGWAGGVQARDVVRPWPAASQNQNSPGLTQPAPQTIRCCLPQLSQASQTPRPNPTWSPPLGPPGPHPTRSTPLAPHRPHPTRSPALGPPSPPPHSEPTLSPSCPHPTRTPALGPPSPPHHSDPTLIPLLPTPHSDPTLISLLLTPHLEPTLRPLSSPHTPLGGQP
ncbi:hypothetical protein H8959_001067 [Pygathrix nigripes]